MELEGVDLDAGDVKLLLEGLEVAVIVGLIVF